MVGNRTVNAALVPTIPQSGEQEISFAIPADAPLGCFVPVYLKAAPMRASNVVTVAIRSGSGRCDPGPIPLLEQKRIGLAVLTRVAMLADREETINGGSSGLSLLRLLPPPGTCTAYT